MKILFWHMILFAGVGSLYSMDTITQEQLGGEKHDSQVILVTSITNAARKQNERRSSIPEVRYSSPRPLNCQDQSILPVTGYHIRKSRSAPRVNSEDIESLDKGQN